MTVTITHVYDDRSSAENTVHELERAGFTSDQISVVGQKPETPAEPGEQGDSRATGAALGGVAGAGAGLLASLGLIAIPGIGPLVAAGMRLKPHRQFNTAIHRQHRLDSRGQRQDRAGRPDDGLLRCAAL